MKTSQQNPQITKPEDFGLIGKSDTFLQTWELIKQVAPTHMTVLITGESGTGKEQIAKVIHQLSPRRGKPLFTVKAFLKVNFLGTKKDHLLAPLIPEKDTSNWPMEARFS